VDLIAGPFVSTADTLLTYLPLAHVFEFMFENASLYWGTVMGYGNPKTISSASTKNCAGDIAEFKPSILVGVPAIWETVRKGIVGKVNESGFVVKNMFWAAYAAKSFLMDCGLPGASILDAIVFKKVRQTTGGRLRLCLNGAAPIAKDTQRFISIVLAPVLGGYGLTETSACAPFPSQLSQLTHRSIGALCHPLEWTDNALGSIPGCSDIKLVDFPEAGYFATNNQGEIWIRGENVMGGYYDDPKQTFEAVTSDGWFKTGDIGEWDKNGHLKLIDRKKNLVKTRNGEYIAIEKAR
jgi:long-chain acyl-CoA synthetase